MATKSGVGMSRHHNPDVAGREAAEQALQKAGVDCPQLRVKRTILALRFIEEGLTLNRWAASSLSSFAARLGLTLAHVFTSTPSGLQGVPWFNIAARRCGGLTS